MTTEKHDPWALLREARVHFPHDYDLQRRIDAALAERQDSATDVVEWASMNMRLIEDPKLTVSHAQIEDRHLKVWGYSDEWYWSVETYRKIRGVTDTLAEAKSAAIAAARGMK